MAADGLPLLGHEMRQRNLCVTYVMLSDVVWLRLLHYAILWFLSSKEANSNPHEDATDIFVLSGCREARSVLGKAAKL